MPVWTDEQFRKTCQDILSTKETIKMARENLITAVMEAKKEMTQLLGEIRSYKLFDQYEMEGYYIDLKESVNFAITYAKINNDIFEELEKFEECLNNGIYPDIDKIKVVYLVREHAYLEDLYKEFQKYIKQLKQITENFEKISPSVIKKLLPIRERKTENINVRIPFSVCNDLGSAMCTAVFHKTTEKLRYVIAAENWLQDEISDQRKCLVELIMISDVTTEISNLQINY